MSDEEEHESRCGESFSMCALDPQRSTATSARALSLLLSGFSMELEVRIWFAAPQRRDLRAMKTRPSAPGKIKAPPRSTSHAARRRHSDFFLCGANLSRALIGRKKRRIVELT